MEEKDTITIVTHSGAFHVDDLFAVALLQLIYGHEHTRVFRSRDESVWQMGDYVVDVGNIYDHDKKRYDHHQHGGAGARANGIPYSALGLVWKHYGLLLAHTENVFERIDREFVTPIDMADNAISVYNPTHEGIHPFLFHNILNTYRPTWKEKEENDERFLELLPWARRILERQIVMVRDAIEGEAYVDKAYHDAPDKRIIILDQSYPWKKVLSETPDALYVVKQKSSGTDWEVECVRSDPHSFENRKSLPHSWRGYRDHELVAITGVSDAVFCHNNGFIAVAHSKEGALALAQKANSA